MAVVRLVEGMAIPAGLEMDLSSKAVDAACTHHPGLLLATTYVEAGKADTVGNWTLAEWNQFVLVIRTSGDIARNHPETWWKGLQRQLVAVIEEFRAVEKKLLE